MDNLRLKLKAFEGPLDLLCHLIQVNEIDIYDIPIVEITRQYMEYLDSMQVFQMEVASDFLVMAATLMEIKSRTLLPAYKKGSEEGEEETEDPRDELVAKIIEYQRYQKAATLLKQSEHHAETMFFKAPEDLTAYLKSYGSGHEEVLPEIEVAGPESLVITFQSVMRTFLISRGEEEQKAIPMAREHYTIAGQSRVLLSALTKKNPLPFTSFFLELNHRQIMIVTFLSLLELMRTGQVIVNDSAKHHGLVIEKTNSQDYNESTENNTKDDTKDQGSGDQHSLQEMTGA